MIVKGNDYKYKELCSLMNDKVKGGKAKKLQLQEWKRFFEWENPTKQIFHITEVFEIPKEKEHTWGGAREGAGAKVKVQEEFDYMFRMFLYQSYRKNEYFRNNANWYEVYVNNNTICKFFGCYENLYQALEDENLDTAIVRKISDKVREKSRSWIFNKISKIDGITLTKGIIAFTSDKSFERKDELLEDYDKYQQEFMDMYGIKYPSELIEKNLWLEMSAYIDSKFEDYKAVKKMHKIIFNTEHLNGQCDYKVYQAHRKEFNKQLISDIYQFFLKKEKENISAFESETEFDETKVMKDYKYMIKEYLLVT